MGIFGEQLFKQSSQVILVEHNISMLEEGRKKLSNYRNIYFLSTNAEKIDLPPHSLDYITFIDSIYKNLNMNARDY